METELKILKVFAYIAIAFQLVHLSINRHNVVVRMRVFARVSETENNLLGFSKSIGWVNPTILTPC